MSGPLRLARAGAALVLVIAISVPPVAAAQGDPPGHGSGTDFRVEGDTLVLTLHLSVVHRISTDPQALKDALASAAKYWNDGLARYRYSGCLGFRIDIDATFVPAHERDFDTPAHTIRTFGSSHVGDMADGRGLPSVLDRHAPPDLPATEDYPGPFENPVEGYWPPWLFEDTAALAHEMGHLFGLGDDYTRDENGDTMPIDGREGTLMDSGDMIDSVLAHRVGDMMIFAEYADQLPECWTGEVTGEAVQANCSPSRVPLSGKIRLIVAPDRSVTGTVTERRDGFTCGGETVPAFEGNYTVTGTKSETTFELTVTGTVSRNVTMPIDGTRATVTIVEVNAGYGATVIYTVEPQTALTSVP